MKEILNAKSIMIENEYKIVVVRDGKVLYFSKDRGIKPLYDIYTKNPNDLFNSYVSDRVTGKAAAMILTKASICGIYTQLISEKALNILEEGGVKVVYDKKVKLILNRDKSGSCPIEFISKDLNPKDTEELLRGIDKFLKSI